MHHRSFSFIIKMKTNHKNSQSSETTPVKDSGLKAIPTNLSVKTTPKVQENTRIKYPTHHLAPQKEAHSYPVLSFPKENSLVKRPQKGRSQSKGFKEKQFNTLVKERFSNYETDTNCHLPIPSNDTPYTPEIVLSNADYNFYLDIEIDEPYDGYYRYPTHTTEGKDNIRDLFFTESGWSVIRFSEKQIHEQPEQCLLYIEEVLESIGLPSKKVTSALISEPQWDSQQAIRWQSEFYREKYLGISSFEKRTISEGVTVNNPVDDIFEENVQRTDIYSHTPETDGISFDEANHSYYPVTNKTGNADFISVTTLIGRFFPFDIDRYIEKKAKEENREEADVLLEYERIRDEAAEKGTYVHEQIEKFLKGEAHDSNFKEFELFKHFYEKEIISRGLKFVDAEKVTYLKEYNIAGTIDALFQKSNGDYVIVDWKRSIKLLVDGYPKKYGYGMALSELAHLDNSSYYKYELQQSFYKYILEKKYNMKVSSMILTILHEKYPDYGIIKLDYREREVKIIINSLNHKI